MKEKTWSIRMQEEGRKCMRLVFLAALAFLLSRPDSYGMSTPYDPAKNGICNSEVAAPGKDGHIALRRLYKPALHSRRYASVPLDSDSRLNADTPIEITYEDLMAAYDVRNDLEYLYSDDWDDFEMDIGSPDLVHAQHWEMPDADLIDDDYGEGILPSETPYVNEFPSATHCKLYEYEDELYYEYYTFTEQNITLVGAVDSWTDEAEFEVDPIDLLITPLPLNINTAFASGDSVCIDDTTYVVDADIVPYGFGTLTTPEGDLDVLVVLNEYNERIYAGGEIIDEYYQPILVFISKEGHQLNIWLYEDSDLEGEVEVDWIEYTRIIDNTDVAQADDRLPSELALFQNYPNPFNPVTKVTYQLKEAGPMSLTVFDQLGRKVAVLADGPKPAGTYEATFDGSGLSSGIYYCRLQTGSSKTFRKMMLMK